MAQVVRATTPTFIFRTSDDVDLTQASEVHVTFSSFGVKTDKTGEDLEIAAGSISVYLNQEDTLRFKVGNCEAMINVLWPDGSRGSSDPKHPLIFEVTKNLLDKVLGERS